jgi:hypothetical protein
VTVARPVGAVPAGATSLDRSIGRAGLFAGAGVLAALNAQADQLLLTFQSMPFIAAFAFLGGVSAVVWFAMYAALKIGLEGGPELVSRRDLAILAAVVALSFVPTSHAGRAGLLLAGAYLFATSDPGAASRRVALVLLALTGPLLWGRLLLLIFAGPILALDAHIVGSVIGSNVDGNLVRFSGIGKSFMIGGPCSSVHNISLAIVLWTTAAALFAIRIDRRYVAAGAAMVGWMFIVNIARLAAIGLFPASFDNLHAGLGAAMFGWAGLIGAALLAGLGVIGAAERQR